MKISAAYVAGLALGPFLFISAMAAPLDSPKAAKSAAVKLEAIPGSAVKRITLTAKAAERLGIETQRVSTAPIIRKQMVSGLVVPPAFKEIEPKLAGGGFGGFAQVASPPASAPIPAPTAGAKESWVLVSLSKLEWERLAKDKPARLFPLSTRDLPLKEISARPSGMEPIEDARRSMLTVYYVVPGPDNGLALNKRMRVELPLAGSEEPRKVVPYSALYYAANGATWVYVNTAPLTYERTRVVVERIDGDLAVLSDGPPVDTPVVTIGAALLYGTEIFGK